MKLSAYAPIAIAMLCAAVGSVAMAVMAADRVERSAEVGIAVAMREGAHDWASVEVDGLQVTLSGRAPDEAARFAAISAAGQVVDATRIIDAIEVAPGRIIERPDFSMEILRNLDGISLIGLTPAGTDRVALLERLGRLAGDDPVTDLLEEADYPVSEGWEKALNFALYALERLPRSKVSVDSDRVAVTAIVEDDVSRRLLETELARAAPDGIVAALDINAPRPVIAPFTVRFLIEDGVARFDACAADTTAARFRILSAATSAGLEGKAECPIGLGAPSLDWGDAVAAGIGALARLGGGSVTFSDADVTLVSLPTVPQTIFDREVGELERALPDLFALHAVRPDPVAVDGTGDAEEGAPEFIAVRSPEGEVQLRGRVPDDRARAILRSVSEARFGIPRTYEATRLDPELPPGWTLRVLAGVDALSFLHNGAVVVQPNFVSVKGDTGNLEAKGQITRLLSERLGDGANFAIDVAYVEALDPIAGLPTPEECVENLNTVLSVQKVTFEPGSATIDADAEQVIDALAQILKDCQMVAMEIGGHTDSQGRESMNQRLSQARANSVLEAIMARRVLTTNLMAIGYGETQPIADNDTEEGREANRRIEFRLLPPLEEASATDDGEGAMTEGESEQN